MFNVEKYVEHNKLQSTANTQCLAEFDINGSWRRRCGSIIDIGCGDGSFTSDVLVKLLPNNFKEVVGTDISDNMIRYANKMYKNDRVSFEALDIGGKLSPKFQNRFDQAFSFFAVHFLRDQEKGFSNIFDLLAPGGSCFLVIIGRFPTFFDNFRILMKTAKWRPYVSENIISPYHDSVDAVADVEKIMAKVGFKNIEVSLRNTRYTYKSSEDFKASVRGVTVFPIPGEDMEEYLNDFVKIARENGLVDKDHQIEYDLIVARGKK